MCVCVCASYTHCARVYVYLVTDAACITTQILCSSRRLAGSASDHALDVEDGGEPLQVDGLRAAVDVFGSRGATCGPR